MRSCMFYDKIFITILPLQRGLTGLNFHFFLSVIASDNVIGDI